MISHSPALPPERDSRSIWRSPGSVENHFVVDEDLDRRGAAAAARVALREAAAAAATAASAAALAERALSLAELLDEALTELIDAEGAPVRVPAPADIAHCGPGSLSPREREVLALVAEGRSNKAIAASLFVSPNTVKTHVTSLLHKLRADSRVQLATIATTRGLHDCAATNPR